MSTSDKEKDIIDTPMVLDSIPFTKNTGALALKLDKKEVKLLMPLAPNINHIGVMYAGALFTLGEMMGGVLVHVYFAETKLIPIVTGLNIKFLKMAKTDISVTYAMTDKEVSRIIQECKEKGKANYTVELELKDTNGVVVAVTEGFYQVRESWERPAIND